MEVFEGQVREFLVLFAERNYARMATLGRMLEINEDPEVQLHTVISGQHWEMT